MRRIESKDLLIWRMLGLLMLGGYTDGSDYVYGTTGHIDGGGHGAGDSIGYGGLHGDGSGFGAGSSINGSGHGDGIIRFDWTWSEQS